MKRKLLVLLLVLVLALQPLMPMASAFEAGAEETPLAAEAVTPFNNVGSQQIWEISHEMATRGDVVDVRVEMTQITEHGMGWTSLAFVYDPRVIANPRLSPRVEAENIDNDFMRSMFVMAMANATTDAEIAAVWGNFSTWAGGNHAIHHMQTPEVIAHAHLLTPTSGVVILAWDGRLTPNVEAGIFLDVRFDVLSNAPLGATPVEWDHSRGFMGGVWPQQVGDPPQTRDYFEDGSVTIVYNLQINNLPEKTPLPTDQTQSQNLDPVPANMPLVHGAPVTGGWTFLGWVRGNVLPEEGADFEAFRTANPGVVFDAGHTANVPATGLVVYTAVWGFNLTVNNVPAHPITGTPVRPDGQIVGGSRMAGQVMDLHAGTRTADDLEFLGWFVGAANVPTPGTNVSAIPSANFLPPATANFTMPTGNETITALWGCDEGYIGGRFNLTVNNVTEYEEDVNGRPTGQAPVTARRSAGEVITLVPGARTDGLEFFGWYVGTVNVPEIGDSLSDFEDSLNFWIPTTANFTMPAADKTLTALWGLNGIVGGRQATFHFYGFDEDSVSVPIIIGEPLDMAAVTAAMGELEEDLAGFAFWGWFEDETLSASGRTRPATSTNMSAGLRRPTVGTNGFNTSGIITQEIFDELEQSGTIHFYAIWALWGDVNDDDAVNGADVNLLSRYVLEFPNTVLGRLPQ